MADSQSYILKRCSKCNCKLVVQRPSGEVVIFQRAIVVKNGAVLAACPECRHENEIEELSYNSTRLLVSESHERKVLTDSQVSVNISVSGGETFSPP